MARKFSIIKKKNLLNGEETICGYCLANDDVSKEKLLKKLLRKQSEAERKVFRFTIDESLYMYLLPGLSPATVKELSSVLYHTAYVVCRWSGKGEKALYLSAMKDTAMRYKVNLPYAMIRVKVNGVEKKVPNPNLYVKELKLCL